MARTAIIVQDIVATAAALEPTYEAAFVDGHKFTNTDRHFLHVKNGGGGATVCTVQTPKTVDGLAVAELIVSIAAGEERMIGPFPPGTYNQPSGADAGMVYVDFDVLTTVTLAAIKLP